MTRIIKILLEWRAWPVWERDEDGVFCDVDPSELPLSDKLKHDLLQWDRMFQSYMDWDCPQDAGLSSKEADALFRKSIDMEGESLYIRMKDELQGRFEVLYDAWFSDAVNDIKQ